MYPPFVPCQAEPDKWFGHDGKTPPPKGHRTPRQQALIDHAKLLCTTKCPIAEQRRCARMALERKVRDGVWAGVEFPSPKLPDSKKRLAEARGRLQSIADGDLVPELAAG